MPQLSIHLFGQPQVKVDNKIVDITRKKAVALLAYLAISGQAHSRDALATMLWPEADQSRARAGLRSALWALNQTEVGAWLVVDVETVGLAGGKPGSSDAHPAPVVDVDQFRAFVQAARSHDHAPGEACPACVHSLTAAAEMATDDFMAGFTLPDAPAFDEWQFFEASTLRQEMAAALERLTLFLRADGAYETAIPYARRLVALDSLHEPAHRLLMHLYMEAGMHGAAWRQYEQCRDVLARELDVEPSPETIELAEKVRGYSRAGRSGSGDGMPAATATYDQAATGQTPHETPNNLPHNTTAFIGRRRELTELSRFLEDETTQLLTIVGPGGIGKTRLAVAAAAEQLARGRFYEGVYFVALAPLTDPSLVVPSVAEAIGYPLQKDQRSLAQQLADYLGQRAVLLVLDNFENLLTAGENEATVFIDTLLQSAPSTKMLVTSREGLNLQGEQRFPLAGLETAGEETNVDYEAATLFLQSARRRSPEYKLVAAEADSLAAICRLVEGMPLALELAASWLETLSVEDIASEIQGNLDFLSADVRNVPDRHRSMQAVFDASWRALSVAEQETYARLAIFRGGFTQAAAKEVAGASLTTLRRLVGKSLLRYHPAERRYDIHELLRQYAAEQLGEGTEAAYERHTHYFAEFLHQREAELKSGRQREALAEIGLDSENARIAFRWAAENHHIALLERSLTPLALYLQWNGRFQEGEAISHRAAMALETLLFNERGELLSIEWTPARVAAARTLMMVLTWQAAFLIPLTRYTEAREALQRATLLNERLKSTPGNDASEEAFLLLELSNLAIIDDFAGEAVRLSLESLQLYRAAGDEWGTAFALDRVSQRYMNQGRHGEALAMLKESLAIRERLGDQRGVARIYNSLGLVMLHIGQIEQSETQLRKSLAIYRSLGNRADLSNPLAVLGVNLLFGGRFKECIAAYEECWAIHHSLKLPYEPFLADVTVTRAMINLGQYEDARVRAEASLAGYRSINDLWKVAFTLHSLGRMDLAAGDAGRALIKLQESATILQKMNERSLLPEVFVCTALAHRSLGNRRRAKALMVEALRLILETGPLSTMRFELPVMALFAADEGDSERAVDLYAAARQSAYIANSRWFEDVAGRRISDIAAMLPPDLAAAADLRGSERELWETVNTLLEALTNEK